MAEEARRWTATYTKHVKQKRKVYQDGYVLLLDKKKAILYVDCDKLVASKFLKEDENLRSGESLTLGTFLVDIGDSENAELAQEEKSKQNSGPDKNCTPRRQKVSVINISPSRRIIREIKKNEKIKYALQEKSPSSTSSVAGEWQALYTTHLTQKAKKYHDGFMELILSGSQGRQARLYDESKTLLNSRFLKKDEIICSGGSLKFDGYLVDIGDPVGHENSANVKVEEQNCNTTEKHRAVGRNRLLHSFSNNGRISSSKNRSVPQSYVTAYTLLKKGNPPHDAGSGKDVEQKLNSNGFNADKVRLTGKDAPNMSFRGGKDVEQKLNSSHVNADKVGLTESGAPIMSLRGAHQILSFLKKPTSPRSIFVTEQAPEKQCSPSPDLVMLDTDYYKERLEGSVRQDMEQLGRHSTRESEEKGAIYEGLTQTNSKTDNDSESRVNPFGMYRRIKIEKDCDEDISVQLRSSSAVVFSSWQRHREANSIASNVSATKTTCSTSPVISSTTEVMLPLIDLENPQPQESMSSKGISDKNGNRFPTSTQSGDAQQHRKTFSKGNPICSEVEVETRESVSHASGETEHSVKMESAKIRRSSTKTDDWPSFELGF